MLSSPFEKVLKEELSKSDLNIDFNEIFKDQIVGENQGFSNPILMIMNQTNPSAVLDVSLNSESPQDTEILRTTLFYLSNFPGHMYEDVSPVHLNQFFSHLIPRLDLVCDSNQNYLQSFFALFNLEQKLFNVDLKSEPIRLFLVERRNYNVHYQLMEANELVSISLSISWLFKDCPEQFASYFDSDIRAYLEPKIEDLKSEDLSKLFVVLSQFGYNE